MDRPLKEHIAFLEEYLGKLNEEVLEREPGDTETHRLESDIRAAELALIYYRQALDLERQLGRK